MKSSPLSPAQLERAIVSHIARADKNFSISARWAREEILRNGWCGYREPGAITQVVAHSIHRKRTRWYRCPGYSA